MRPTFASFYVAKSGLDAARANLSITGQNMTNAGTNGYTRQRVDLYAMGASGGAMRYASARPYFGEGASIGSITQLRDPYLDVRYRREHSKLGETSAMAETLHDLEYIFDDTVRDGVTTQLQDFMKQLQNLSISSGDPVAENIVKTSAGMLVKIFKSCSTQLQNVKQQEMEYFDSAVKDVNALLTGIADLNVKIRDAHVAGNPALELKDSRNLMIDQLSSYLPIETSTRLVDIGSGTMIEEISISMTTLNGDRFNLVDHDKARNMQIVRDPATQSIIQPVKLQLFGADGLPVGGSDKALITLNGGIISDEIHSGSLLGHMKMLNGKGEYDMPAGSNIRGIQYYENMLDSLVNTFAEAFNKANSTNGGPDWDKPMFEAINGKPKIDTSSVPELAGYTINIGAGNNPHSINTTDKVITLNLPANATNADVQKALQDFVTANSSAGGAFDGATAANIGKIKVDGNLKDGTSFGSDMSRPRITAANIGISKKWENTSGSYITATKENLGDIPNSDTGNNIQYMINLLSKEFNYNAPGSNVPVFKGSFAGMFSNIAVTLGIEASDIKRRDDGFALIMNDIQTQRASVSSVNVDEEAINMIQYQHSLTAASRYMTTLDEAVDTIINKMGVVGR